MMNKKNEKIIILHNCRKSDEIKSTEVYNELKISSLE